MIFFESWRMAVLLGPACKAICGLQFTASHPVVKALGLAGCMDLVCADAGPGLPGRAARMLGEALANFPLSPPVLHPLERCAATSQIP